MHVLANEPLIAKSIEYAIDLPIDFNTNSSLLRLLKGVLANRDLTSTKSISIQDDNSLRFSSYSMKAKLKDEGCVVPVKFQIYNKQADFARLPSQKEVSIPGITRFEFTILSSRYPLSEQALNNYKDLYYCFVRPIDPKQLILFEQNISFQLYKNFCQEKVEAPKLQVTAFIVKNSEHFMTKDILCNFYQLLFQNKFVKSPLRKFYFRFKKTKDFANIKFSCLQELNNLIGSLRAQLS